MFEIQSSPAGQIELTLDGRTLLRHDARTPALFLGRGREDIRMFRGNFDIRDRVDERLAPRLVSVEDDTLRFAHPDIAGETLLRLAERDGLLVCEISCPDPTVNRLWLRLYAEPGEHLVGGGEQFSALDLRGRLWPIWTREQGVGRNKLTEITRLADALDGSGGDYYTTFFPQPTLVSSRLFFVHLENTEYAELDLREQAYSEIALWSGKACFVFGAADSYEGVLEKLTGLLGRQSPPSANACSGTGAGTGSSIPGLTR